ncbi:glycosyltransferase [Chitinimonas sp.]|uniref:glycosyltransferase n=1 Tax=Chitinimonas sp. TaxID=1934313 RepID=UPI0035B4DBFE
MDMHRQMLSIARQHADLPPLVALGVELSGQSAQMAMLEESARRNPDGAPYYQGLQTVLGLNAHYQALCARDLSALTVDEQVQLWLERCTVLQKLQRHSEACFALQHVLALKPADLDASCALAALLGRLGRHLEAVGVFDRLLAAQPDLPLAHSRRGECLLQSGNLAAAQASFERALALSPEHADAVIGLAQTLNALGQPAQALRLLDRITPPADAAWWSVHGAASAACGQIEAALDDWYQALAINPDHQPSVQARLAALAQLAEASPVDAAPAAIAPADGQPMVSVILACRSAEWGAQAKAAYTALLGEHPHEILLIDDAGSLSEAYNRGSAASRGELLIYSHEGVSVLSADMLGIVLAQLQQFDLLGVAGSTRLQNPDWELGGQAYLRGMVADQTDTGAIRMTVFNLDRPIAPDIELLDERWLAVRRAVWQATPFDEAQFDGWAMQGADFSFRAIKQGFKAGVAGNLLTLRSPAKHDADARYANRFRHKHACDLAVRQPLLVEAQRRNQVTVSSEAAARAFGLLALKWLPLQQEVDDYQRWLRRYYPDSESLLDAQREAAAALAYQPLISVLVPVWNPPVHWLARAIDSVRAQTYGNWQLCIADDASTDPEVAKVLRDYMQRDSRIQVAFRQQNGHISAASNSALELVQGEFVALLDHDDELSPQALYWVAKELNRDPELGLIYSDEDKVDEAGVRHHPYFKPDWNPDLFLSQNMISHLGVYRSSLLRDIGGFRIGLEGSQDYDLALRCIERLSPRQIAHIPRVLYHWRTLANSTASGAEAKPYASNAGRRALEEHLARTGISAQMEPVAENATFHRIRYALPSQPPLVSIIIPTRNGLDVLRPCIDSLKATDYPNREILIIDNGSDDAETLAYMAQLASEPGYRVLRDDGPFNYSALNNGAARQARGELICLLNNDIEAINADWLSEMVAQALRPGIGAVGARLWYPDDTLQHGGVLLIRGVAGHAHVNLLKGHGGYFGRAVVTQNLSAVTAACLVIRKAIYDEVGGLDEDLAVAFNDVDFCLRVQRAGYRNLWTPFAELYHHESKSRGHEDTPAKQARFSREVDFMKARWGNLLNNDPAYNPNLTLTGDPYSLAWPPRQLRH